MACLASLSLWLARRIESKSLIWHAKLQVVRNDSDDITVIRAEPKWVLFKKLPSAAVDK